MYEEKVGGNMWLKTLTWLVWKKMLRTESSNLRKTDYRGSDWYIVCVSQYRARWRNIEANNLLNW